MAVATPAMLPVPTVEASAVDTAWNGLTLPAAPGRVDRPSTSRNAAPSRRNWTPPVRTVRAMPVPMSRTIIGGPQTYPLSQPFQRSMASTMGERIRVSVEVSYLRTLRELWMSVRNSRTVTRSWEVPG